MLSIPPKSLPKIPFLVIVIHVQQRGNGQFLSKIWDLEVVEWERERTKGKDGVVEVEWERREWCYVVMVDWEVVAVVFDGGGCGFFF